MPYMKHFKISLGKVFYNKTDNVKNNNNFTIVTNTKKYRVDNFLYRLVEKRFIYIYSSNYVYLTINTFQYIPHNFHYLSMNYDS